MPQLELPELASLIDQVLSDADGGPTTAERVGLIERIRRASPEASRALDARLVTRQEEQRQALRGARGQLEALRELVDKVTAPPLHPALLVEFTRLPKGMHAVVATGETRRVVAISPEVSPRLLKRGAEVLLGPERNVILAVSPQRVQSTGDTATFERHLADDRMIIRSRDEEIVVDVAQALRGGSLKAGDLVRWSRALGVAFERVERGADRQVLLEDTPAETFASVGGLDAEIARLTRSIRLQRDHGDLIARYGVKPKRSVLLSGPPGTGKTLLARALANWLASISPSGKARFCPVIPGSLSSPWYGQSEANIRSLFTAARAAGEQDPDSPVVIWLDEVDGIGGRRGGSFNRVDDRVLLALMAELDGFGPRGNVLVVAATNRRADLDPGLLRPGRLGDLVLEIRRPNRAGAAAILTRHFPDSVPVESGQSRDRLLEVAVGRIYAPNGIGVVAQLTLRDGRKRAVTASELVSGAVLAQVAQDAIERAAFREAEGGQGGVRVIDLLEAADDAVQAAAESLSPVNCRNHLDDLPQDVDVVKVEPSTRTSRRDYRYLRLA
ncbi:MAG: AAA family ATPase [Gemmatimonadales bacterium]